MVDENRVLVTAEADFAASYEKWRSPVRRGLAMAFGAMWVLRMRLSTRL